VKFTLAGEVAVHAALVQHPAGQRLRIEVRDTGVGISREAQATLFQRFSQADGSTTRRFGGTGLGLAITQRLAEMMGGEVGVRSVLGEGSVFWIEVAAPATEAVQAPVVAQSGYLDGLSVLVVEDNAVNRMIASKMLENLGACVTTAEDGEQGVEAAAVHEFDLVLMDIQMPGIDGVEATRRIRALPGAASQTPIIALTANVMAHQRQDYLNAGMNGVVGKPINPSVLLAEIARLAGAAGNTGVAA
jgi:CheY-like chemotaxis protein